MPFKRSSTPVTTGQRLLTAMDWKRCPAKTDEYGNPGKTVLRHSLETISVLKLLLEFIPEELRTRIPDGVLFIGGGHDCGKISPGFMNKYFRKEVLKYIPDLPPDGFSDKHAEISEAAIKTYIGEDLLPLICGYHHGIRERIPYDDKSESYGGISWAEQRQNFLKQISLLAGAPEKPITDSVLAAYLAGILCVADWIASDEKKFTEINDPATMEELQEDALKAVTDCGWQKFKIKKDLSFSDIFGNLPYKLQDLFAEKTARPGIYILEAPMGCGKTEAALYAAYKLFQSGVNRGLYFALPTRVTSNKIHERVEEFLNNISDDMIGARLIHGSAWLERGGGEFSPGGSWFMPSKRALLLPFGVGTIDQALLGVLNVKHFFLRLAGLAGKVVIFDEVHSYDLYTGTLLDILCRCLVKLKCTVIILSATLTAERRFRFFDFDPAGYEYPTDYPVAFTQPEGYEKPEAMIFDAPVSKEIHVKTISMNTESAAKHATDKARRGCCVLLIANTVAAAQEYYKSIRSLIREDEFPVGLLHSRFPAFRREELEEEWLSRLGKNGPRPEGCILVSTQIVEQSVDIDADYIMAELAPSDMLLQRLGRLWRHKRAVRPVANPEALIITECLEECTDGDSFMDAAGPGAKVYAPAILWRTCRIWREKGILLLPADIRSILEETYSAVPEDAPAFIKEFYNELKRSEQALRATAINFSTSGLEEDSLPSLQDTENAHTRWGFQPQTQILLLKSCEVLTIPVSLEIFSGDKLEINPEHPDFESVRMIHRNLVSVHSWRLAEELRKKPPFLRKIVFDNAVTAMLVRADGQLISLDGRSSGLAYTQELGIFTTEGISNKTVTEGENNYESEW